MIYGNEGYVPDEDYIIPFGVADVKREGADVTVITYSRMVLRALEAAEKLAEEGISVEVIDLRTLKPLDMETIAESVKNVPRRAVLALEQAAILASDSCIDLEAARMGVQFVAK